MALQLMDWGDLGTYAGYIGIGTLASVSVLYASGFGWGPQAVKNLFRTYPEVRLDYTVTPTPGLGLLYGVRTEARVCQFVYVIHHTDEVCVAEKAENPAAAEVHFPFYAIDRADNVCTSDLIGDLDMKTDPEPEVRFPFYVIDRAENVCSRDLIGDFAMKPDHVVKEDWPVYAMCKHQNVCTKKLLGDMELKEPMKPAPIYVRSIWPTPEQWMVLYFAVIYSVDFCILMALLFGAFMVPWKRIWLNIFFEHDPAASEAIAGLSVAIKSLFTTLEARFEQKLLEKVDTVIRIMNKISNTIANNSHDIKALREKIRILSDKVEAHDIFMATQSTKNFKVQESLAALREPLGNRSDTEPAIRQELKKLSKAFALVQNFVDEIKAARASAVASLQSRSTLNMNANDAFAWGISKVKPDEYERAMAAYATAVDAELRAISQSFAALKGQGPKSGFSGPFGGFGGPASPAPQ
jgi:hypothetical protein